MRRTKLLQEIRKMRFEEAYAGWTEGRLTQAEAALILGICERSFRRYLDRYESSGVQGLADRRLEQASNRWAQVDEVMRLASQYRAQHLGWNVRHFHSWYKREGGTRSYSWVATLFLDGELRVRRFTAQTAGIIKLIPGDAGRPITDLVSKLDYPGLAGDAARGAANPRRMRASGPRARRSLVHGTHHALPHAGRAHRRLGDHLCGHQRVQGTGSDPARSPSSDEGPLHR